MPSPFPGLDPFIEGQLWTDFHSAYINALREFLVAVLDPRYIAVVEERVYLERGSEQPSASIVPDVSVVIDQPLSSTNHPTTDVASVPVHIPVSMPQTFRETFIELRLAEGSELVTVVEVLSPTNKRAGQGRTEYLAKRDQVLMSAVNMVELDLLRGGEPLPMAAPLPRADGYIIVCEASRLPMSEGWPISLRAPLPRINVPLKGSDPPAVLDLQVVFQTVYDRAGYARSLKYKRDLTPPLDAAAAAWVAQVLATRP